MVMAPPPDRVRVGHLHQRRGAAFRQDAPLDGLLGRRDGQGGRQGFLIGRGQVDQTRAVGGGDAQIIVVVVVVFPLDADKLQQRGIALLLPDEAYSRIFWAMAARSPSRTASDSSE